MARRPKTAGTSPAMPIEVDPSFVRVFADQTLVMNLGRDIDIALLAVGPKLERIHRGRTDSDNDVMKMRPQLNEVARVRLNPNAAAVMSMEILQSLIKSGIADKSAIVSALEETNEPDQELVDGAAPEETDSDEDGLDTDTGLTDEA